MLRFLFKYIKFDVEGNLCDIRVRYWLGNVLFLRFFFYDSCLKGINCIFKEFFFEFWRGIVFYGNIKEVFGYINMLLGVIWRKFV